MHNKFLHITSVHDKFLPNGNILYKLIQDDDKSFEDLGVPKSLALTILVIPHNYHGHVGTNKTCSLNWKRNLLERKVDKNRLIYVKLPDV